MWQSLDEKIAKNIGATKIWTLLSFCNIASDIRDKYDTEKPKWMCLSRSLLPILLFPVQEIIPPNAEPMMHGWLDSWTLLSNAWVTVSHIQDYLWLNMHLISRITKDSGYRDIIALQFVCYSTPPMLTYQTRYDSCETFSFVKSFEWRWEPDQYKLLAFDALRADLQSPLFRWL